MIEQFSNSPELQGILKAIQRDPYRFTDEQIINHVDKFLPSYNCEGAALGYFSIISHLCYYRNDLEKPLLKIAIKPLYYLGISDAENQIKWVQSYVNTRSIFRKNDLYYTSWQGKRWIMNALKDKSELVSKIIREIECEDDDEELL
ncbi:hypothetical protein I6N90_06730 [Paenibacillus sp. GSMTC-2017]|uniref:hypothetical protein n=1 Tax=Paenibacillus sp. GSMTC-2017 TaxID=2794350 RepID=UPI0018D8A594|nr:hypothetical protein [Paenibacillus sp. GSMTC-2017]MBH5317510.1 hypothetical protein [Paenibacillus sp. GSMTC-2017]